MAVKMTVDLLPTLLKIGVPQALDIRLTKGR